MNVTLFGNMKHMAIFKCVEFKGIVCICKYSAHLIVVFKICLLHFSQQYFEGHLLEAGGFELWKSVVGW